MIRKSARDAVSPYVTRDASVIRELMHPAAHGNLRQSLAEAIVPEGGVTLAHYHVRAEELYHILEGSGLMRLEGTTFPVAPGDTVCIEAGRRHCIANVGTGDLRFLCCCSPAYSHEDTILTASEDGGGASS